MLESVIEKKMCSLLTHRGALCVKQEGTMAGLPDRLVVLPDGRCIWVELKQNTGHLRQIQKHMIEVLRRLNQDVRVIHGMQEALAFVEEVLPDEVHTE